jgi:hypothetical protein
MAKAKKSGPATKASQPVTDVKGVGNTYSISTRGWHFEENPSEFRFNYTTPGPHCKVARLKQGRCATQLNFIDGKPVLRLCGGYGEPGKIVHVDDPQDAQLKAQSFCATKRPKLEGLAQTEPIARRPEPRGRRQSNPVWLAAGIAMGVVGAVLLAKRPQTAGGTP